MTPAVLRFAPLSLQEINALEAQIVAAKDRADDLLWQQAAAVMELNNFMSQREISRGWENPKTGEPYVQRHVALTIKIAREYSNIHPRPRFGELYNQLANPTRTRTFGSGDPEWYTPPDIIEAARVVLGSIDLDPASNPTANEVVQAAQFYSKNDNGLKCEWRGTVWMNPPFSRRLIDAFTDKLLSHVASGDVPAAIALTRSDTSTLSFQKLSAAATAISFPSGRLHFWRTSPDAETGQSNYGTAIFYLGPDRDRFATAFTPFGVVR